MRTRTSIALFLPLACLLGCTLPATPPASTNSPASPLSGNWTNWQIQAGAAITSPPTGLYFTGAVQTQDSQSSAVFTNFGSTTTGSQVLSLLGTYYSSTGVVALYPVAVGPFVYDIGFAEPSVPYTVIPVSVIGGCVYPLNYQGPECMAITGGPAVGVQIAPLNGTYTGTLTDSASPSMNGTGTLTLSQSATPVASGAFPLTGTITFPTSSGFGTYTLSGMVSGEGITLYDPTLGIVPVVSLTASTNPAATEITVSNLALAVTASDIVTFTGTLTRQ
jgi:hypothetical protein